MPTNKCLNDLDNEKTSTTTIAEETLEEGNFFIAFIYDTSNEVKNDNQQINTTTEETNAILTGPTTIKESTLVVTPVQFQKTRSKICKTKSTITKSTTTLRGYNKSNIPVIRQFKNVITS